MRSWVMWICRRSCCEIGGARVFRMLVNVGSARERMSPPSKRSQYTMSCTRLRTRDMHHQQLVRTTINVDVVQHSKPPGICLRVLAIHEHRAARTHGLMKLRGWDCTISKPTQSWPPKAECCATRNIPNPASAPTFPLTWVAHRCASSFF
jgi:hypothetical protein